MSYEPILIVERNDLEKHEDELAKLDREGNEIGEYLYSVIMNSAWCEFKKLQLYILEPEFSSFNRKVREWLDDHKIEYGENN